MKTKYRLSPEIPFVDFYQSSKKEASRKKPVFFVHRYFARRITINYRLILSALSKEPLSKTASQIKSDFYSKSKKMDDLVVLDPFMGGGTTIFEALRFGAKVIGNDLQPLSLMATSALVKPIDREKILKDLKNLEKQVGNEIKDFYQTTCPICHKKADAMYTFHVKTIKFPEEREPIKLFSSYVLALKGNVFTVVCPKCGRISETDFKNGPFKCECGWILNSPKESFVDQGEFNYKGKDYSLLDFAGRYGYPQTTKPVAIEYFCPNCHAHGYKTFDETDKKILVSADDRYLKEKDSLPIPKEKIPEGYNTKQILNHGYRTFSDLFSHRQLLSLGLLWKAINEVKDDDSRYWFQVAFSGMLEMNNMFCRYQANAFKICNIFFNHAYVPISMPTENCVWGSQLGTGTFVKTVKKILRGKDFCQDIYDIDSQKNGDKFDSVKRFSGDVVAANLANSFSEIDGTHPLLKCGDSRSLDFVPDESVDIVLTDPPYGANVMYSELIDFFHSWDSLGKQSKEFNFQSPLTPKKDEILINPAQNKDSSFYCQGLTRVLLECYKKTKDDGYLVFSFHDSSFESWIAVMKSIFESGFSFIRCFPAQSETRTGAHTSNKNSVGIDLMLVSQKLAVNPSDKSLCVSEAVELAFSEAGKVVDQLIDIDAEITLADVKNVFIAKFFEALPSFFKGEPSLIAQREKTLQESWNNDELFKKKFVTTEKRSGWWSKMFEEKWNVETEDDD